MIKRITMIEPKNDHLHIYSQYQLPRLGGVLLGTIMKKRGFEVEAIFMETREVLPGNAGGPHGISTITPTALRRPRRRPCGATDRDPALRFP